MPAKRPSGKYQARVSWQEGRRKINVMLGTHETWEEARLAEIEFKLAQLEEEKKELAS